MGGGRGKKKSAGKKKAPPRKRNKRLVKLFFGTTRERTNSDKPYEAYSTSPGVLTYGTCEVSIPPDHRLAALETPKARFLGSRRRHVVLLRVDGLTRDAFLKDFKEDLSTRKKSAALVFVHGFNVTFEDAARRTGQIAYDLGFFEGVPAFFSWPSVEDVLRYKDDEQRAKQAVPHIRRFLAEIESTGVESIYLLAHSMGNRVLTRALVQLAEERETDSDTIFHQIILTAPDIDADIFRRDIAEPLRKSYHRVTLYASSKDKALSLAAFDGRARAGQIINGAPLILPGINAIDVSGVDTNLGVGHFYYGSNRSVLSDMFNLIHHASPPDERFGLEEVETDRGTYWRFQP